MVKRDMHGEGGIHGEVVCVTKGGWIPGECVVKVACMVIGACMAGVVHGRGCVWQETCKVGRGMCGRGCMQERWPLKWAVHILLECTFCYKDKITPQTADTLGGYSSTLIYICLTSVTACKMQCPLNLVLESWEYLWFYLTFWIAILDCGLKLHKLLIHILVMLQK